MNGAFEHGVKFQIVNIDVTSRPHEDDHERCHVGMGRHDSRHIEHLFVPDGDEREQKSETYQDMLAIGSYTEQTFAMGSIPTPQTTHNRSWSAR